MTQRFADTIIDDAWYQGRASAMRGFLGTVAQRLRKKLFAPELPQNTDAANRLWELAVFQISEMDKCFAGAGMFAANVMGASVLEAVLLLTCLRHQTKVEATKVWQKIHKNEPPKPFPTLLAGNRIGLAALLKIAQELNWLDNKGIPPKFRSELVQMAGEEKVSAIEDGIPEVLGGSWIALILSTGIRNMLHPGRTITQPFAEHQFMGTLGAFSSLIALGSLLENLE